MRKWTNANVKNLSLFFFLRLDELSFTCQLNSFTPECWNSGAGTERGGGTWDGGVAQMDRRTDRQTDGTADGGADGDSLPGTADVMDYLGDTRRASGGQRAPWV